MIEGAELVRCHGRMVWETAYRLLGRESDAADCCQEVFAAALEMGRKKEVRSWEGMLKRIVTVKALDALRRRIRERRREAKDVAWGELAAKSVGPGDAMEKAELIVELRRALLELPAMQAEAFCLRHISGMSYEEIAGELGTTVSAVGVVLNRAKKTLSELMGEQSGKQAGVKGNEVKHVG
jgi:RNA polymerase sigma-70 factor (ECF subfamily)